MKLETHMRLAANMKLLRVSNGYTQTELARRLQSDRSVLALCESGRRSPDLETVYKLSKLYGIRMETLLECDPVNIVGELDYTKVCENGEKELVETFRRLSAFSKGRLLEKAEDLLAWDAAFHRIRENQKNTAVW